MAITLDSRQSGQNSTGATSITWNHTVGAGANFLIVGATTGSAVIKSITSVTWNGTGLSNTVNGIAATKNDAGPNVNGNLWWITAPAAGTFAIVVTPSASCELTGGSESLAGVNQTSPFNAASPQTAAGGGSTNPTITVTSAVGEWVVDSVGYNESGAIGTITAGAGQTAFYALDNGAATSAGSSSDEAGAASVVMSWTASTSVQIAGTGIVAVSLKPDTPITFITSNVTTIATAASTWSMVPGGSSMVGGGAVILGIGVGSSAVTVSTITDNTTNVYLKAVARGSPRPVAGAEIWYTQNYSTASTRISVTLSALSSGSIGYLEVTGLSTANMLGPVGSSAITTVSTTHSAAEVTSSLADALVVSFARLDVSTTGTVTKGAQYTLWASTNLAARTVGQYWIQSATSTATGTFTTSSGANHAAAIAIFYSTVVIAGGGGASAFRDSFTLLGGV